MYLNRSEDAYSTHTASIQSWPTKDLQTWVDFGRSNERGEYFNIKGIHLYEAAATIDLLGHHQSGVTET